MRKLISIKSFGIFAAVLILFISLSYLFSAKEPRIISVFPLANDQIVSISAVPYAVFSSPQNQDQQAKISVSSSPELVLLLSWSTDGKILYIKPNNGLAPNTAYTFNVNFPGKLYSWSFKTIELSSNAAKQGEADYRYNQALNKFYNSHPWYNKIPENDNYFIGFDARSNEFFVDLYPKKSSSLTIEEQTNQFKKQVIQTLISIGVDLSSYKIVWAVYPQ